MAKNILVICTSLRARSNSEALADAFIQGAEAAGNSVEKVTLRGKRLAFCTGCMSCQETHRCVIQDDAVDIAEKMGRADAVVFATPIYYYEMSGQMKTLLDRANPLYASDYAFRQIYLLTTAAEDDPSVPARALSGLTGWVECFQRASMAGSVFAGGVDGPGEISGHPALRKAYELGRSV